MPATISAKASVPFISRLIITTIEPVMALIGALMAIAAPQTYADTLTRHSVTFTPDTAFLYTALGGSWLYFTFVEVVVLRAYDDLALWRLICTGMLLSDFAYMHSVAQAVGGWAAWSVLADWTPEDWATFLSTAFTALPRILIVLGIGLRTTRGAKKE